MQLDNKFILAVAVECMKSYEKNVNLGSTEYALTIITYEGKPWQVLSTPGTNEMSDWFWNLYLRSTKGVKRCSYLAADRVHEEIKGKINPFIPLAVTGHSKDAPTALQYMAKYGADACIAFCPAPAFRRFRFIQTFPFIERIKYVPLKNTLTVYDPDDLVPAAGIISFGHRTVERTARLPKDKTWYNLYDRFGDHLMNHVISHYKSII